MVGRMASHRALVVGRCARAIPVAFIGVFFVWPVVHMAATRLRPGAVADVLTDASLRGVAWFTLWQAVASTALSLAIGLPLTWAVSRWRFPGSRLIAGVVSAAFLLPTVSMAAGVATLLPSRGIPAILWAHVAFNVAIVLRVVGPTWAMVDGTQLESASSLGATPARVFRDVTWPAISGAVRGSGALVFSFCFTSFAIVSILGGPTIRSLETEVYTQAVRLGDVRTAVAISVVQAIVVLIVLSAGRRGATDGTDGIEVRDIGGARPSAERAHSRWVPAVIALATASVVLAPIASVLVRSLRDDGRWTVSGFRSLFDGSLDAVGVNVPAVLRTSVVFATVTAVLTVTLALMACRRPRAGVIERLTIVPVTVSAVTVGLGLVITFDAAPFEWRGSAWLVPVVHSVIALPLAVRAIGPSLRAIRTDLVESAADLGASPLRSWWTIQLPLLRPALLRAAGISAAVSWGEFGATSFLTRSGTTTVPIAIGQLMGRPGPLLQQAGFALAALTVVSTAAVLSRV